MDPDEREAAIVSATRRIAEREGWDSVTSRRLATEVGFSQPVLYGHFPDGLTQIKSAVARQGFAELARVLESGDANPGDRRARLAEVAAAYLAFARAHPATYRAMFELPLATPFANRRTPTEMRQCFAPLSRVAEGSPTAARSDNETAAEVLWSALHGLATLERDGRVRRRQADARLAALVGVL